MATRDMPEKGAVTARFAFACWGDGERPEPALVLRALDVELHSRAPNRVSETTGFL